jgi:hypothetical protein
VEAEELATVVVMAVMVELLLLEMVPGVEALGGTLAMAVAEAMAAQILVCLVLVVVVVVVVPEVLLVLVPRTLVAEAAVLANSAKDQMVRVELAALVMDLVAEVVLVAPLERAGLIMQETEETEDSAVEVVLEPIDRLVVLYPVLAVAAQ